VITRRYDTTLAPLSFHTATMKRKLEEETDSVVATASSTYSVQNWLHKNPAVSFRITCPPEPAAELLWCWDSTCGAAAPISQEPALLASPLPALPFSLARPSCGVEYVAKAEANKQPCVSSVLLAAAAAAAAAETAAEAPGVREVPEGADLDGPIIQPRLQHFAPDSGDSVSFVTFRSNLNKVLGTVIDSKTAWTVDACVPVSSRRTCVLDIIKTDSAWDDTAEAAEMASWGYVFEARCTASSVADANAETCVLVRTRVGRLAILLAAEVDARCGGNSPLALSHLRELKTLKMPTHRGQHRTLYQIKHAKWWLQSHLAGVEHLLLGARDDAGMVTALHAVRTDDLPRLSAQNGEPWSPTRILAFGEDVLGWMHAAASSNVGQHIRFTYSPCAGVISVAALPSGTLPARIASFM